ncbi:MAG: 4-phosphopantoate--beta-alanine ligase [Spirochaetia bacterium]
MNKHEIPKSHPRYESLHTRGKMEEGMRKSIVAPAGLVAHGRGEAFDYLLGEKTPPYAAESLKAAAAAFVQAEHPVISVNGNVAVLVPQGLVELSEVSGAALEINLFYRSQERMEAIEKVMREAGAINLLGLGEQAKIPELESNRRIVDPEGIYKADLVFVPLEDGDRTEALVKMGKKVITVDLNPISRTARMADITIVDNITRVVPALIGEVRKAQLRREAYTAMHGNGYDNKKHLSEAVAFIADTLQQRAKELL